MMNYKSTKQITEEWDKEAERNPVIAKALIKCIDDIREIKNNKIEIIAITVVLTVSIITLILLLLK